MEGTSKTADATAAGDNGHLGQCSICLDTFPFNDPVTAFAQCGHVACRTCLKHYVEAGDDCCPWCRVPLTIKHDDVAFLPVQSAVMHLLDNGTAQTGASDNNEAKAVVLCCDDDSPATHFCTVCDNTPLCSDCVRHHQRARRTQSHELIPVDADATDTFHHQLLARQCAVHKGHKLDVCCMGCSPHRAVCRLCMESPRHAAHVFKPLAPELPQLKQQLLQLLKQVDAVMGTVDRELEQCRNEAAHFADDIDKQVAVKRAEIKALLERKHKGLKPREAKIVSLEIVQLTMQTTPGHVRRQLRHSDDATAKLPHGSAETAANLLLLSALQSQPLLEHVLAVANATTSPPLSLLSTTTTTTPSTTTSTATSSNTAVGHAQQQWTCVVPHPKLHVQESVITHLRAAGSAAVVDQRKYTAGVHSFTVQLVASHHSFSGAHFGMCTRWWWWWCGQSHKFAHNLCVF
eukprot:TRINITY_DN1111_c1_g1_i4.p1 TRINITY_DN1111_c1_g1~~TRINITY_DN1111_c1_g1_i4.p1  ORF type:complete len:469 (+),score=129.34 TRINITY_DN1111_c1_g1_i4:28-1407(+)